MLSDEEKERITERVRFEQSIRESLAPPSKAARFSVWGLLNSSLGLLLVTSLITAYLVPRYQAHKQQLDWQRQITADNLKYRLDMMRECLMQFSLSNAQTAEAYERVRPIINRDRLDLQHYEKFKQEFVDLQNRRFQTAAKVMALVVYFPNRAEISETIARHNTRASLYLRTIESYVDLKYRASRDPSIQSHELKDLQDELADMSDTNKTYTAATNLLLGGISREEERYEKFQF